MKHTRIIITHYGGPDALRLVEEDYPEPKDGEVRVRVLAAGGWLLPGRKRVVPAASPVSSV